jgi:hypothetical protein
MKKVLVLDRGAGGEWYGEASPDGCPLRCYRLAQAGRLELLRVLNDGFPYWLVMIRNFNQSPTGPDRIALQGLTTPWGNGVWRYLDEGQAHAKFQQLSSLPIYALERARAVQIRDKKRERIKAGALDRWAFQKPITSVAKYITEAMEAACN